MKNFVENKWIFFQTLYWQKREFPPVGINFVDLEDSMVMYDIYNSDTLEILINTVHKMHNKTMWNENYLYVNSVIGIIGIYSKDGVGHYTINSPLNIARMREKYVRMYKKFISQLQMYANVIRVLSKGY